VMFELEYKRLPVYEEYHLRFGTYYTAFINARDDAGIQRSIEDIRSNRAIFVMPHEIRRAVGGAPHAGGIRALADLLSGAHTAGSDLAFVLAKSYDRLTKPMVDFVTAEYVVLYDRDGLVAYGPRDLAPHE